MVVHEGRPSVRRILPLSLTFDHRVVTGGEAARFLVALKSDLERAL
jgi:pyruvate dehydrogenase E2 component (dihydrolipoamide acetyltransferase)